jgi:ATP-binding cassette subfamily F protein 3
MLLVLFFVFLPYFLCCLSILWFCLILCVALFIVSRLGKDSQYYRSVLGRYGLSGDLALQKSETLSGGQKSRVVWAHMSMKQPHIMVFDEPTNHLDIETVDVLVQALNSFQGMFLEWRFS